MHAHPRLNVLWGDNGQGKTNIIEAIAIALSTKPLRSVKLTADLITHGCQQGRIEVTSEGEGNFSAAAHLFTKSKKHELSGKALKDHASLLSRVALVSFVPDELQIVHASASHRRRALNQITAGFFPTYVDIYRRFEKALHARNQLLKVNFYDPKELTAFNEVFAALAAELSIYREEAVALWKPYFLASLRDIVGKSLDVTVDYVPSAPPKKSEVLEKLSALSREESFRRVTLCGPHLDELAFQIGGKDARFDASRGQARAIVLALKLGQLNAIAQERRTPTLLLLDDVTGELDPHKIEHLMQTVSRLNIQTFLTTTHLAGLFEPKLEGAVFQIKDGRVI